MFNSNLDVHLPPYPKNIYNKNKNNPPKDPGKHHIKALSIVTGNRRAAPSSIASKSYEVDYNPRNQHSSKKTRVDPDIRAE